ncbi:MAG: hypothetical protein ACRDQF_18185, partial [Thermocrispum sp.]
MTGVVANVNAGLGTLDAPNATLGANPAWTQICPLDRIPLASGVAALLPGGVQVAVFRTDGG